MEIKTIAIHITFISVEKLPCLPVRILLRPLKKRFQFHFTGSRQTARIDRPEWFLTQTLTWIKHHQGFVRTQVQPVADKIELSHVRAVVCIILCVLYTCKILIDSLISNKLDFFWHIKCYLKMVRTISPLSQVHSAQILAYYFCHLCLAIYQ